MDQSELAGTYRTAIGALLAGFVMLVGTIAGFAARVMVLGWTFLVLMLVFAGAGFVLAVRFRNRAVLLARQARAEHPARAAGGFRGGPPRARP